MRFSKNLKYFCLFFLFLTTGCSPFRTAQHIVGISLDEFEKYRDQAISQHVACKVSECFNAILAIGTDQPSMPHSRKDFEVFQAKGRKGVVVFYGIPGQVDTTEVGVFITPQADGSLVEIISRSSSAQKKVARAVFTELDVSF